MAKKKVSFARAIAGDESMNKIGTYDEAPGGGTPKQDGGGRGAMNKNFIVVNSKEEADEIREENPNAKIRYNQPRDENGQFTYNSANAKPLVDGPSRGTSIPPFLHKTRLTFAVKKEDAINYNGLIYLAGIDMTASELIDKFKEYNKEIGGFSGLTQNVAGKRGRRSGQEKKAISTGDQGVVVKEDQGLFAQKRGKEEIEKNIIYKDDKETFLNKFRERQLERKMGRLNGRLFKKINTDESKNSGNNDGIGAKKENNLPNNSNDSVTVSNNGNNNNKLDIETAKNNPQKFMSDNYDVLEKLENSANNKGYDIDIDDLVDKIANGEYSSFKEIEDLINNL